SDLNPGAGRHAPCRREAWARLNVVGVPPVRADRARGRERGLLDGDPAPVGTWLDLGFAWSGRRPDSWWSRGRVGDMAGRQMRLAEPKDSHQSFIDTPLLLRAHLAHEFAEPSYVDGTDLLN